MNPPRTKEPPYSCPNLDAAITEIEAARKIHDELRTWGGEWKDAFYELDKETSSQIEELEAERDKETDRAGELEDELKAVRMELEEVRAELTAALAHPKEDAK